MKKYLISLYILFLAVSLSGVISAKAASISFSDCVSGENFIYESGFPAVSLNGYVSESNPEKTISADNQILVSLNGLISDTLNDEIVFNPSNHTISINSGDENTVLDYLDSSLKMQVLSSSNGITDIYFPLENVFSENSLKKIYNKKENSLSFICDLRKSNVSTNDFSFILPFFLSDYPDYFYPVEEDFSIEKLRQDSKETQNRNIIINVAGADPIRLQKEPFYGGAYVNRAFVEASENGDSRVVFELNKISACNFDKTENGYKVNFVSPREKYSKIVVIDPGHGGYDYGAVRDKVREAHLNLAIAEYIREPLENEGIKVYFTRENDIFLSLETRPAFSTEIEADMFISIHQNTHSSSKEQGMCVYYSKDNNDALENGFCSKVLGQKMIKNLYYDIGVRSNGLLTTPLSVTAHNKVPAILIECGFMTNPEEFAKLQDPAYQKEFAENLAKSVIELFAEYPTGR